MMPSIFVKGCPGCLSIVRYESLDKSAVCLNCGMESKLNGGRSEIDQHQLKLFAEDDLGPRLRL